MSRTTKSTPARPQAPEHDTRRALFEKTDVEFERLCRKYRINKRRCGLLNFRDEIEKICTVNLLHGAEKYPGCLREFFGYLRQDAALPDAGSFNAILWAAVESYKQEGTNYE